MNMREHIETLRKYVCGKLSMTELRGIIDDRLFELRRSPEKTAEEDFLSGIELLICEIEDRFRTSADLEEYIKSIIFPGSPEVVWDGTNSISPVTSSSSNRDAEIISVKPMKMVEDCRFQATFA